MKQKYFSEILTNQSNKRQVRIKIIKKNLLRSQHYHLLLSIMAHKGVGACSSLTMHEKIGKSNSNKARGGCVDTKSAEMQSDLLLKSFGIISWKLLSMVHVVVFEDNMFLIGYKHFQDCMLGLEDPIINPRQVDQT